MTKLDDIKARWAEAESGAVPMRLLNQATDDVRALLGEVERLTSELAERDKPEPPKCNSCWSELIGGGCVGCAVAYHVRDGGPDPFEVFPKSAHAKVRKELARHGRAVKP